MRMRTTLISIIIAAAGLTITLGVTYFWPQTAVNPDPNHAHADFAVWINGKQLDFSGPEYMSVPPATEKPSAFIIQQVSAHGDEDDGHVIPGRQYLHLHDQNGHVIHGHKPGLSFGDFLLSVGFTIGPDRGGEYHCLGVPSGQMWCDDFTDAKGHPWKFFVNGHAYSGTGSTVLTGVDAARRYVFADNDALLFTYGADDAEIQKELGLMTHDACLYSKTCPWRGTPPSEGCIADPTVPCRE